MMKKKLIKILIIVLCLIFICIFENKPICYVIMQNEIEGLIMNSDKKNKPVFFHYYCSTDSTQFVTTNIGGNNIDTQMIIAGGINPRLLKLNNDFILDRSAFYMVISPKIKDIRSKDEKVIKIFADNIYIILKDIEYYDIIINNTDNGKLYVKDLSFAGHINFYLSPIFDFLN